VGRVGKKQTNKRRFGFGFCCVGQSRFACLALSNDHIQGYNGYYVLTLSGGDGFWLRRLIFPYFALLFGSNFAPRIIFQAATSSADDYVIWIH
jgi:hypothetical protein